jgi:uncharacterized protein (TIGR00730 family)
METSRPIPPLNQDKMTTLSAEMTKIMQQIDNGYQQLAHVIPAVTIFGSARTPQHSPDYLLAEALGYRLSELGFAVLTGGGPGVMEAANKGAFAGKSMSIGLNIQLPHEQRTNSYQNLSLYFEHFSVRKMLFIKHSCAYVVLPGGLGTLDELSEVLVLAQTEKMPRVPIILVNSQFWNGLLVWLKETLLIQKLIDAEDLALIQVADDVDKIQEIIMNAWAQHVECISTVSCTEVFKS